MIRIFKSGLILTKVLYSSKHLDYILIKYKKAIIKRPLNLGLIFIELFLSSNYLYYIPIKCEKDIIQAEKPFVL